MPVLKTPPKHIRNATIQVRVEDEIDFKLRKYAEFIDCSPAYVVSEALKMLFSKDGEFREWLTRNGTKAESRLTGKPAVVEAAREGVNSPTMFDDLPRQRSK
jgi:hypothetical protein